MIFSLLILALLVFGTVWTGHIAPFLVVAFVLAVFVLMRYIIVMLNGRGEPVFVSFFEAFLILGLFVAAMMGRFDDLDNFFKK